MTACDNVALAQQIDGFSEDMTYVQTWVETDALKAQTPSGKCRLTLAGLIASASVEVSPVTTVESKLWSEISAAGGLFEFENLSYRPSSDPGQYPIFMFINGSLSFDFVQSSTSPANSATVSASGLKPDDEIVFTSNVAFPVNQSGCGPTAGVQYITLEQFNAAAGTGGNDTEAFKAACDASVAQGRDILLLAKVYLINPSDGFNPWVVSGVNGLRGAQLKCAVQSFPASGNFFDFRLPDGGSLKNFTYDGNLTADPTVWTSENYDTWGGGRGLRVQNSNDIVIENVHVKNVSGPSFGLYNCNRTFTRSCTSIRSRGNFGDGFFVGGGEQHTYENCYAYDFTRIGFTNDGSFVEATNFVNHNNCIAIYGHDGSNLYGGIESNAGFWTEYGVNCTYTRCLSYDTKDSGFRAPIITHERFNPVLYKQDAWNTSYYDCVAGKTREAFIGGGILERDTAYHYINCIAYDVVVGFYVGDDSFGVNPAKLNKAYIINCKVFISSDADLVERVGSVTHRGVLPLGGDVTVDGLDIYYVDVPDWLVAAKDEDINTNGAISYFGEDRPRRLQLKKIRSFNAITKQPIDSRVVQGGILFPNEFIIEDSDRIFMDTVGCGKFVSRNVTYSLLGTIVATQSVDITGGAVASFLNIDPSVPTVNLPIYSSTLFISLDNVRFSLANGVDQSLYIANINNSTDFSPKVRISRCRFRKDMSSGSPITVNADVPLFDTSNVMRFIIENNLFINTGGSSSRPLVRSLQREVPANTVNVQIMGKGNFRSANTSVLVTSGVISTNFEALAYDGA